MLIMHSKLVGIVERPILALKIIFIITLMTFRALGRNHKLQKKISGKSLDLSIFIKSRK